MANTGMERSLTVTINKKIAGVTVDGYPKTYYGRDSFTWNGLTYFSIDTLMLQTMTIEAYQQRLSDFQSYVESQELGLSFATDLLIEHRPYRENTTACPII